MLQSPCYTPEVLSQLVRGTLSEKESEQLESHLLQCSDCAQIADTLCQTDDLAAAMVSANKHLTDPQDQKAVEDAIERATATGAELLQRKSRKKRDAVGLPTANGEAFMETIVNNSATSDNGGDLDASSLLQPAIEEDELGRLGGYRVLEILGRGGMGVVFRAEDPELKRSVALKVMSNRLAADPRAKERFLQEARAAAALEHDHIIQIYQVGEDQGVPFIAMPLLQGESLHARIDRERPLPVAEVVRIGREIAAGLAAAHSCGLIHRDIKPDNIWLQAGTDRVKIVDFGLVRNSADDAGLTHSGMLLGTPRYMAPEQAEGRTVDHRCDLFSLGSVLYEAAAGQPAFSGSNLTATLIAVAQADPVPVQKANPDLDPELGELIMQLLRRSPEARPQAADEVRDRLAEIEQRLSGRPGRIEKSRLEKKGAPPVPVDGGSPRRPPHAKALLTAVGLAALILLSVMTFKFRSDDSTVVVQLESDVEISTVEIDGHKVEFQSHGSDVGQLSFEVDPGAYQLTLTTTDGLTLTTNLGQKPLEVKAGDTAKLRAWVEPATTANKPSKQSSEPDHSTDQSTDREVAEWVLSLPAGDREIYVLLESGLEKKITKRSELPDAPFGVSRVRLGDIPGVTITDAHLKKFSDLGGLVDVRLGNCTYAIGIQAEITEVGLEAFSRSPAGKNLRFLSLSTPNISNASIPVLNQMHMLEGLLLKNTQIDDMGIRELRLPNLASLTVINGEVSAAGLVNHSQQLPALRLLDLRGSSAKFQDFSNLSTWKPDPLYGELRLVGCGLSDESLASLGKLVDFGGKLQLVFNREITDAGLAHLANLKKLSYLDIRELPKVSEAAVRQLERELPATEILSDHAPPAEQ